MKLVGFLKYKSTMGYKKLSDTKKIHQVVPPCEKTMYYSIEEAQDMIRYIKQNRRVRELYAYQCAICGFWHLTSKSK
jgi:predicted restriction endonuclease